ncbi:MAG: hypothetical protein HC915_19085, partial [Anaerolineae bacterium]|nr:hypothetical protein [Anaerolineae bacterium]
AAISYQNALHYTSLGQQKEDEKTDIRRAFERFVAPSVVESVLNSPQDLGLGGCAARSA